MKRNRIIFATISAVFVFSAFPATSAPAVTKPQSPVECWAHALGGRARLATVRSIHRTGVIETGGLQGTTESWTDSTGRSRSSVDLGVYSATEVLDRNKGWAREGSAPSHELGESDLRRLVSEAWIDSGSLFFPDRMPGTVTPVDGSASGESVLRLEPEGGRPVTVHIDKASCLPTFTEQSDRDRVVRTSYLSWTTADGIQLPLEVRQSTGDPKYDVVIRYQTTEINPKLADNIFTEPEEGPSPVRWLKHSPATVPMELTQNHIYLPVRVNGGESSSFLLDTGADMTVIDRERAESLGMTMKGSLEARGAGSGSMEMATIEGASVRVGDVELPLDGIFAIPLTSLALREGRPLQGILGYNVVSHFVVEIAYGDRVIRLHDPSTFTPPDGARAFPVEFDANTPVIHATLDLPDGRSLDARMLVDTGDRGAVSLNRPYIESQHLLASIPHTIDAPLGMGVGGLTHQLLGRISAIHLGPWTVTSPITSFSQDTAGANANPDLDGAIGGEVLRRFTLFVDYPHKRLLLRPNDQISRPFEYDMSGMLLVAADASFDRAVVRNVLEPSPAAEAGIRVGDEITAVRGKPVASMSLDEIRSILRIPGENVTLTIRRGSDTLTVTLRTKRLI
ncbi:MAG: aspartyl protease family protein [Thermoanaerobaculia bacterium]